MQNGAGVHKDRRLPREGTRNDSRDWMHEAKGGLKQQVENAGEKGESGDKMHQCEEECSGLLRAVDCDTRCFVCGKPLLVYTRLEQREEYSWYALDGDSVRCTCCGVQAVVCIGWSEDDAWIECDEKSEHNMDCEAWYGVSMGEQQAVSASTDAPTGASPKCLILPEEKS